MVRTDDGALTPAEAKERLREGPMSGLRREGRRGAASPPSLRQAKERLREAASRAGPAAWVGRHPLEALAAALIGGMITGGAPRGIRAVLGRWLGGWLLRRF
ncbi:MAG TPA: hypothetical protein VKA48_10315 [Gammaproteobacteria bacterium]|nr:hypothetical protein [Gammaproteobacteria bacterium]